MDDSLGFGRLQEIGSKRKPRSSARRLNLNRAFSLAAVLVLASSCGGNPPKSVLTPSAGAALPSLAPTPLAGVTVPTVTPIPECFGPLLLRWVVGLGEGTDPLQVQIEGQMGSWINDQFGGCNGRLVIEVIPKDVAASTLAAEIQTGAGPDIVGPVNGEEAGPFQGQWLNLAPFIQQNNYDLSQFSSSELDAFRTDAGLIGLPFSVDPAAVFYHPSMFDAAGLNDPPARYGEAYTWPDGTTEAWSFDTLAKVARRLTLDAAGRNATQAGFDRRHIVQYGYTPQGQNLLEMATFWGAGTIYAGSPGGYTAVIPEAWKAAWHWCYEGIWGRQPFIPAGTVINSPESGSADPFADHKVAMVIALASLTNDLSAASDWDLAALPASDGQVHGRVDAATFFIWQGTRHPEQSFRALTYLINDPVSSQLLEAYGAMPARSADQAAYFNKKSIQTPEVRNWEVLSAGLDYPDIPSADGYLPNRDQVLKRFQVFEDLIASSGTLNLDHEISVLQTDLQSLFNR